jgi:dTDP-4-dehydrorhamnose reductase
VTSWLVTGAGGMLGRDLTALLTSISAEVTAPDHAALDITDAAAVTAVIQASRPDVVVNCAAWTAVDAAEAHPDEAMALNGVGPATLAAACAAVGARLVQLSTDYVFSGSATAPYGENDPTGPRTVYGQTKLAGEKAVLRLLPSAGYVVRTAWLYGAHGSSFVRTMIRLEGEQDEVRVVDDECGQPTWTVDVAGRLIEMIDAGAEPGIYHATSSGVTTRHGLAQAVFRLLGADPARVSPIASSTLSRPAPRPAYSVLGHDRWRSAGLPELPAWQDSLGLALPVIAAARGCRRLGLPVSAG